MQRYIYGDYYDMQILYSTIGEGKFLSESCPTQSTVLIFTVVCNENGIQNTPFVEYYVANGYRNNEKFR